MPLFLSQEFPQGQVLCILRMLVEGDTSPKGYCCFRSICAEVITLDPLHLSELTDQTIPVSMISSVLIKTLSRSVGRVGENPGNEVELSSHISQNLNSIHEGDGFQQKLVEKAYFIFKLSGGAVVRPASSDK